MAGILVPATAQGAEVVNGGFEAGDLSGWTVDASSSDNGWFAYTGTDSPNVGAELTAPPQGDWAAVTQQQGPGTNILYQDVALEPGFVHRASMYVYYKTNAELTTRHTLDATGPDANQQYRVDVMRPGAAVDSVDRADLRLSIFRTKTGDRKRRAPTLVRADLSRFAGKEVRLRFAEADNRGNFYASTDAVGISSLKLGASKKNERRGTAKLPVTVLEQGALTLEGRRVATRPKGGPLSVGAGKAKLLIKPTGAAKEKLNETGRVKVTVKVTFTPAEGTPVSATKKVRLRKDVG